MCEERSSPCHPESGNVASSLSLRRFGGWSAANKSDLAAELHGTSSNLLVWYNNKADHALPAYINSIHNAMLRAEVGDDYGIITFVHPLLLTEEDLLLTSSGQMVADYGTVLILIAALGFLPSALIPYLIMERANEEKRVQMVRKVELNLFPLSDPILGLKSTAISFRRLQGSPPPRTGSPSSSSTSF